jgi:hypothetical protein
VIESWGNRDTGKTCKEGMNQPPCQGTKLETRKIQCDICLNGYQGCRYRPDMQGREEAALIRVTKGLREMDNKRQIEQKM